MYHFGGSESWEGKTDTGGIEELIVASDGVQAAVVNSVWHSGIERQIEGSADLRCKLQLAGSADYSFQGANQRFDANTQ